jgi:hypothetical protein
MKENCLQKQIEIIDPITYPTIIKKLQTLRKDVSNLVNDGLTSWKTTIRHKIFLALSDLQENQKMIFPPIIDFDSRFELDSDHVINYHTMRFSTRDGTDLCEIKKNVAKIVNPNDHPKKQKIATLPQEQQKEIRHKVATDEIWEKYGIKIVDKLINIENCRRWEQEHPDEPIIGGVDILKLYLALYYQNPISPNGSKPK